MLRLKFLFFLPSLLSARLSQPPQSALFSLSSAFSAFCPSLLRLKFNSFLPSLPSAHLSQPPQLALCSPSSASAFSPNVLRLKFNSSLPSLLSARFLSLLSLLSSHLRFLSLASLLLTFLGLLNPLSQPVTSQIQLLSAFLVCFSPLLPQPSPSLSRPPQPSFSTCYVSSPASFCIPCLLLAFLSQPAPFSPSSAFSLSLLRLKFNSFVAFVAFC